MKNLITLKLSCLTMFALLFFGQLNNIKASESDRLEILLEENPANLLNLTSMCSNEPTVSRRWRVRNISTAPISYTWDVYGTNQSGSGIAAPGDSYFETVTVAGSPNTTRIFWTVEASSYNKVKASGGAQCETTTPPSPPAPCGSNLIVNGDFENGNTGFTSEYTFKTDVSGNSEMISENTYGVDVNVALYHPNMTGTGRSGKFLMVNGNTGTIKTVWSQTINVVQGASYNFSAFVRRLNGGTQAQLSFSAGDQVLTTYTPNVSGWAQVTGSFTASLNGTIVLKIVDSNLSAPSNDFGIDDLSFTQNIDAQPPVACYETAILNPEYCTWSVEGTMPIQPMTACYETATFNTESCSWDVEGVMPVQPMTACYETATFNTESCSWDVEGVMPVQPITACYETATFNTELCSWDVTGTMPVEPVVTCNDIASFNIETCSWIVTLGGNLIVNGDFEAGNSGFTSGYTYKVDGAANNELVPENTYGVGANSATYHPLFDGVGRSGNFMIVNGNTSTIKTVWSQPVTVEAGKEYTFSINVSNVFPAAPANLRFMLGADQIGLFTPVVDGVSEWFNFTISYTPSASGSMALSVIDDNLTKYGNDFGIDDISFVKVCVEEVYSCYANEVISFNQKKQNDGSTVSNIRSNPAKALGAPENNDTQNFVSLGFGGDITLKFAGPIKNGDGNDVRVIESSFGGVSCARYPETIRAFASQDGCNFVWIGDGCQDTDFDLGSLAWAQYIKLVDISPIGATYQGTPIADAYDVDGIMCLNGGEENPVPSALVSGTATQVIDYMPGLRKNGTPITPARTNPANALGLAQGTDVINFVALGFGGSLVLKFDYVIFDNPLTTDIRITETSFGNPSCAAYGEKAMVEGSLDGINWIMLTDEDVCLDGEVDINNAGVIQYVRITDRSASTHFSGSADGYDVDGLAIINGCSSSAPSARMFDNTTTANEVASAEVFPNPFNESTNVEITTGDLDNSVTIRVTNFLGQQVYVETLNVASSSVVRHNVAMNDLSKGVYFLTVETNFTKETVKLVKN